jgi:hypothetical protein
MSKHASDYADEYPNSKFARGPMADTERAPAAGAQEPDPAFERVDAVLGKAAVYYARQGLWDNEQDARSARTYLATLAAPAPHVAEPSGVEREDEAWLEGLARCADFDAKERTSKGAIAYAEVAHKRAARCRRILASLRELAEWRERSRAAGRIAGELNRERLARLRAGRDATPASERGQ